MNNSEYPPGLALLWLQYLEEVKFNFNDAIDKKTRKKVGVGRITHEMLRELYYKLQDEDGKEWE
jgi:hypothetical protein